MTLRLIYVILEIWTCTVKILFFKYFILHRTIAPLFFHHLKNKWIFSSKYPWLGSVANAPYNFESIHRRNSSLFKLIMSNLGVNNKYFPRYNKFRLPVPEKLPLDLQCLVVKISGHFVRFILVCIRWIITRQIGIIDKLFSSDFRLK